MPPVLHLSVAATLGDQLEAAMATRTVPPNCAKQIFDPNALKVVLNGKGLVLYFNGVPIHWKSAMFDLGAKATSAKPTARQVIYRDLGNYAYRVGFLKYYVYWPPESIDQFEVLEQPRVLFKGEQIAVAVADQIPPPGIDTIYDYHQLANSMEVLPK